MKRLFASWRKPRKTEVQVTPEDEQRLAAEEKRAAATRATLLDEVTDLVTACVELRHSETSKLYDLHLDYLPNHGFIYMRLDGEIVTNGQGNSKKTVVVKTLDSMDLMRLKYLLTVAQEKLEAHKLDQLDNAS